jgi:ribosomal protein L44E
MEFTEEDRIKQIMMQPMMSNGTIPQPKPGPNYTCHRCGERGHFIKFCPTNGNPNYDQTSRRSKRPSGIPTTFLQVVHSVDDKEKDSLLELSSGQYARRVEDHEDFKQAMKKNVKKIPDELTCKTCHNAPRLAVMTRCCNYSFCFECISPLLISGHYQCPCCHAQKQNVHSLIPNERIRDIVIAIQNGTFKPYDPNIIS